MCTKKQLNNRIVNSTTSIVPEPSAFVVGSLANESEIDGFDVNTDTGSVRIKPFYNKVRRNLPLSVRPSVRPCLKYFAHERPSVKTTNLSGKQSRRTDIFCKKTFQEST